jgi:1-hydroxycarotenoid 3,4-desaturase
VIIIGAGMGGLAAAALLSARGLSVTVIEKEATVGGKIRQVAVGDSVVAAGPTVFTMRPLFEELFDDCGGDFGDAVAATPVSTLARHAWTDGTQLDLHADHAASVDAISTFAGAAEGRAYSAFAAEASQIWSTLDGAFLRRQKTNPIGLTWRLGLGRITELQAVRPYQSLWSALRGQFRDPRLVQMFARYATYCGCSPFKAPATLMLIAHLESRGVWQVEGGLHRVASAVAALAERHGAQFRMGTAVAEILVENGRAAAVRLDTGERIEAAQIIANCDPSAVGGGMFGASARRAVRATPPAKRSLSAMTWTLVAQAEGFPLDHHNVFFSGNYRREFDDIAAGRMPTDPTVYICAQDRGAGTRATGAERFQIIVNAPATGDHKPPTESEIDRCESAMLNSLRSTGLSLRWKPDGHARASPTDYEKLFPSTGGALYGRASHGPVGSFLRPGSRTRIAGLYLAGGSTHPGAGVPMAALSGRLASEALLQDRLKSGRVSMFQSRPAAMHGGMSTPSPTMGATD